MYNLTLGGSDQERSFQGKAEQTLLAAAQAKGHEIPYACRGGGCGMCKIRVEEGQYELGKSSKAVLPDQERAEGYALACKTFPRSDMKFVIASTG